MPSAAAAQGQLPGQVPGQAGAPAQQLPAQPATTRPTAACHQPLMRRTATSCCCLTLLRSCTRLPLMTALSPQLLLPMVCTVMICSSFSNFICSIVTTCSNFQHTPLEDWRDKGRLSHMTTLPACCMYIICTGLHACGSLTVAS